MRRRAAAKRRNQSDNRIRHVFLFLELELETKTDQEEYDAIQKTANSANKTMPIEAANTKPGIRSGCL
jgi:hypothetical protein